MEIKCTSCGKEVTPLELYDGSWSCPSCRHALVDHMDQFVITHDNEELFRQSEILYANWLFNRDGTANISAVDQAVRLCRQSARMGNPKALARLAYYYDKDYAGKGCSEITRFKIAFNYYSMICYCGISEVETQTGLPPLSWGELREKTAHSMLQMLATAPIELRENSIYSFKTNYDRLQLELGLTTTLTASERASAKGSVQERVFGVFCSCLNKQRAPLFGVFKLTVGELIEIYKKPFPGKEEKIPHALYWLTTGKKVLLAYIEKDAVSESSSKFQRLSTQSSVEDMVDKFDNSEELWVFFFNHNGGHKYIGSVSKRDKIQKTIFGRTGTDILKTMIQNGNYNFYTFYDDDVYQYMKQSNPADATKALVDKICNGGDEI